MKNATILQLVIVYCSIEMIGYSQVTHNIAYSQAVKDPISFMRNVDPGDKLAVWNLDLNQDGITDMLIARLPNAKEIVNEKEDAGHLYDESQTDFTVFIGKKGGGYTLMKYLDMMDYGKSNVEAAGIFVLLNDCYIGQIDEIKQYGIVSIEKIDMEAPSGHGLPVQGYRIVCYYMKDGRLIEKYLTKDMDYDSTDLIYDKYLSNNKLVTIALKTVE